MAGSTAKRLPILSGFDPAAVPSPAFVLDLRAIEANLNTLRGIADRAEAKMLVALKAFAAPPVFELFRHYLDGAAASGVYEARLAHDEIASAGDSEYNRDFSVHTSGPAYRPDELSHLLKLSDHLVFNSLQQWVRSKEQCLSHQRTHPEARYGLRLNPECAQGSVAIYDPCAPHSRLGTTAAELERTITSSVASGTADPLAGLTGVHVHALCEDDTDALEAMLAALDDHFAELLHSPRIEWLNIGGGHHITRPDYDRERLVQLLREVRSRYNVEVIVEPGEAVVLGTGVLVASVLDVHANGMELAILDTSATAHMPDVLEMPYRPDIRGAAEPGAFGHTYRLGGQTCLAGDVIGDYSFQKPLKIGDRLVFEDMSHYTMVKTTTFNGIPLPTLAVWDGQSTRLIRSPHYDDFRSRLG